mmetsp:Transcript_18838/g.18815  ORF Transcript_18838/g.18815 Transcript_18838/m.18815 type:complete len:318 (+) Transcript_18838:31-984(+)
MPSSFTSTCSNSEVDSLKDLLENEEVRYVRKGYGLITAIIIVMFGYFILPSFMLPIYKLLPYENKFLMYGVGCVIIHELTYILANLVMYLIYHAELPFFERYKISNDPWPWKKNPELWKVQLKKTIKNLLFNNLIVVPLVASPSYFIEPSIVTSIEAFPTWKQLIPQTIFFMLVEDTTFYWLHRLLHTPRFYGAIHKKHHEYINTIGIASEYAHPLEFAFGNLLPAAIGPLLLGNCHIYTIYMWNVIRLLETTDGHSGYDFSWSAFRLLPLSGSANYHNFHHSHNVGNYSSFFTYWDTICKTNTHYWRYLSAKEKSE